LTVAEKTARLDRPTIVVNAVISLGEFPVHQQMPVDKEERLHRFAFWADNQKFPRVCLGRNSGTLAADRPVEQ